jgi:hypothetical protein
LDDKNAATLKFKYRLQPDAKMETIKKMLESSFVTVKNAEIDKDKWATFDLEIKDATKLNTASLFKNVRVAITDGEEKETKVLQAKSIADNPMKLPDRLREYYGNEFRLSLTFPGDVVKSNATETKGNTATWKMTLDDLLNAKETLFQATYKTK